MATANTITAPLSYIRQDALKYIFKPMFVGDDIRSMIYVDLDCKGDKYIDFLSTLKKISRKYAQGQDFTRSGSATLSQKLLSVKRIKAEVAQAGSAFFGSVKGEAIDRGVKWDNIEGTVFAEMVAAVFTRAVKADLIRQTFFGDTLKEVLDTNGVGTGNTTTTYDANNQPTAGPDVNFNIYDGFWTTFLRDIVSGVIPSKQVVTLTASTVAVKQVQTETLASITGGTITLTINGIAYTAPYTTSASGTAAAFLTTVTSGHTKNNQLELADRDIAVTVSGAVLTFTSTKPGRPFTVAETSAGTSGTWTGNAATANVVASDALAADAALTAFEKMYTAMSPVMRAYTAENSGLNADDPAKKQLQGSLKMFVTSSVADNFRNTLESGNFTTAAFNTILNGVPTLMYRGIPIIERPDWDETIATDFGGVYKHRALLTVPKNLVLGADGEDEEMLFEEWYEKKDQANYLRAQYKAGIIYLEPELVVIALG